MFTFIIVAYNPDKKKFQNFLKKIGNKNKILIVNNSENNNFKDIKFSNKTKILKSKNNGNGAGINLALRKCKTKFAIYSDIDVKFKNNFIKKFIQFSRKVKNFTILVPNHGNLNFKKKIIEKYDGEASMMLFDVNKLKKVDFFDEKFFLYYEEIDLLHRLKKNNLKSFFIGNLKIKHIRASSIENESIRIQNLRSWHYMWSMFYFYRKNFNYLYALKETIIYLIKDTFMFFVYLLIFNKKNMFKRFYRIYGLACSMVFLKSFLRL